MEDVVVELFLGENASGLAFIVARSGGGGGGAIESGSATSWVFDQKKRVRSFFPIFQTSKKISFSFFLKKKQKPFYGIDTEVEDPESAANKQLDFARIICVFVS